MTSCGITCPSCGERIEPVPKEVLRYGTLVLRVDVQLLRIGPPEQRPQHLSPAMTKILAELMRHADRVCSVDQLMTAYNSWDAEPQVIPVYISNLRKLLIGSGVSIATAGRSGYMLTTRDVEPFHVRQRAAASAEQIARAVDMVCAGTNLSQTGRVLDLSHATVRRVAMRAGVWPRSTALNGNVS